MLLFILIINFKKTIRLLLTLKLRNKTIYKEFNLNSNRNIVILSIIYLSLSIFTMFKYIEFQKPILEDNVLISHAMGEIDGYYYTNSLEAFENSYYNRGSRVFEVDLSLTKEGVLVARHDWGLIHAEQLGQTPETLIDNEPWSYDYFIKQKIFK